MLEGRRPIEHDAKIRATHLPGRVLEHPQPERREPPLDMHHQVRAQRAVAAGEEHRRRPARQPRQAKAMQRPAQLRQARAQGGPVPLAGGVRDQVRVREVEVPVPHGVAEDRVDRRPNLVLRSLSGSDRGGFYSEDGFAQRHRDHSVGVERGDFFWRPVAFGTNKQREVV